MKVERVVPSAEGLELIELVREYARERLAPAAAAAEEQESFPRERLVELGELGLFAMPYPEEVGGLGQPYEVYLQALEELATAWMSVALGVSVHVMTCHPVVHSGTDEQRARLLPGMLGGRLLGAYSLSEPQAGSDVDAIRLRAEPDGADYVLDGEKAWVSHGGLADYYLTFARTGEGRDGLSCFVVDGVAEGLAPGPPERKMGLRASPTTPVHFEGVRVDRANRIGPEGAGQRLALSALANGRLGIAACSTGLAQAALAAAVAYAREREQFGGRIADFQGIRFLLAEMAAKVAAARATYLHGARKCDAGMDFVADAAVAKLVATDAAMSVTTEAVQVLGGYGYVADFPVERYFREAKVTQIFEGTNQIQRLVIARSLLRQTSG
ncbi:acyl-CoA dehydrogenase family protein [Granulicoccus sp. GXG6511]|uniref:acyl-CoA dehydrogenase family protein n=1 Tax=Granulicoccus sp. GXG6511 TaxID=3381351 RepID=UPI003D7F0E03